MTTTEELMEILTVALERLKADGCKGCKFEDKETWEDPCRRCKNAYGNYWRAK